MNLPIDIGCPYCGCDLKSKLTRGRWVVWCGYEENCDAPGKVAIGATEEEAVGRFYEQYDNSKLEA